MPLRRCDEDDYGHDDEHKEKAENDRYAVPAGYLLFNLKLVAK